MSGAKHSRQRFKGCGLCDTEKRAGNSPERKPFKDRRSLGLGKRSR